MDQSRRKKSDPRDILPPLVGLILIGLLFIPGVKPLLGSGFVWLVSGLSLAVAILINRTTRRMRSVKENEEAPALPIFIHSDEERAQFRAMMGVKERPPASIKVVKPYADDSTNAPPSL